MQAPLIVLLHGVRARGIDMNWLAGALSQHLPHAAFAQPDAPFPHDEGEPARQWFSHEGITADTRPSRVQAARPAFDATLDALLTRQGPRADLSRVALVGFSQGAIMALDAALSGRWPVAAVVGFSGRLATPPPLDAPGRPILLVHGTADRAVPVSESVAAARAIRTAGGDVRLRRIAGLDHIISAEAAGIAGRFLHRAFATGARPATPPGPPDAPPRPVRT